MRRAQKNFSTDWSKHLKDPEKKRRPGARLKHPSQKPQDHSEKVLEKIDRQHGNMDSMCL